MILLRLTLVSIRRIWNKIVILIAHPEARQLLHIPHIEALVIAALFHIVLGVHRGLINDNDVGFGVVSAAKRTCLRR